MIRKILAVAILCTSFAMVGVGHKKFVQVHKRRAAAVQVVPSSPVSPIQPESPPQQFTLEQAIALITQDNLQKDVAYLASDELEGRMSGKQGNVKAAEFIKQRLESFGLPTMSDVFQIRRVNPGPKNEQGDTTTQNIYAWIEGTDPTVKDEVIVIGAHMDHIGYGPTYSRSRQRAIHPGADDNASGTAGVLEVAQALSKLKNVRRTIVFQFYSAEEMGLLGSQFYCKNPKFPKAHPAMAKHIAMINLDMIGHLGKGTYMASDELNSSVDLKQMVTELSSKYIFAKQICNFGSSNGGSDHISFYNKGVPVVFLNTGLHAAYHTPEDKPNTLNYQGMEQIARFVCELAWNVSESGARIKFNYGQFHELPCTHDHGYLEVPFMNQE